LSVVLISE